MPEIEIHEGQFMRHDRRRPLSSSLIGPNPSPVYVKVSLTEEKGSDVNLASWLLWDAISGDCTEAVVITNDSDLATPLDMVANKLSVPLTLINPQLRSPTAYALQKVGVATKQLHLRTIKRCQLPNPVVDPAGRQIRKPRAWFNRYWRARTRPKAGSSAPATESELGVYAASIARKTAHGSVPLIGMAESG